MMDTNELYEKFQQIRDVLGAERLLDELYCAMAMDETEANLEYIAKNWDIEL